MSKQGDNPSLAAAPDPAEEAAPAPVAAAHAPSSSSSTSFNNPAAQSANDSDIVERLAYVADVAAEKARQSMTEAYATLGQAMAQELASNSNVDVQGRQIAQLQMMAQPQILAPQHGIPLCELERSQANNPQSHTQTKLLQNFHHATGDKINNPRVHADRTAQGQILPPGESAPQIVRSPHATAIFPNQNAATGAGSSPVKPSKKPTKAWRRRLSRKKDKFTESHSPTSALPESIMIAQVPTMDIAPPSVQSLVVGKALPRTNHARYMEGVPLQQYAQQPLRFRLSSPASVYGHGDECVYSCCFAPPQQQIAAGIISRENAIAAGANSSSTTTTLLATTGQDGTARIWCVEGVSGSESIREVSLLRGHGNFECVRFCWGDGVTVRLVATTGADGTAALWDAAEQKVVERLPCGEKTQVYSGEFVGGESTLFVTGYDNVVSLWDIQQGRHEMRKWKFQSRKKVGVAAPNGIGECFVYSAHSMKNSNVSHGPNLFAVALSDGSVCLVDLRDGSTMASLRWQAHERYVCEASGGTDLGLAEFSTNAVMTASGDGTVKLWDLRRLSGSRSSYRDSAMSLPSEPTSIFSGHHGVVYGASFIKDYNAKVSGTVTSWGADGTVRMWSALERNPTNHHEILYKNENMSMHGFAFGPSLKFAAAVGSPKGQIQVGESGSTVARWHLFKTV